MELYSLIKNTPALRGCFLYEKRKVSDVGWCRGLVGWGGVIG